MKKLIVSMVASVILVTSGFGYAGKADIERMTKKVCAPCHGVDGKSLVLAYPNLAGQKKEYMIKQLKAFRSGERKSPKLMNPVAQRLTDAEIKGLSKYYSKLSPCDVARICANQ